METTIRKSDFHLHQIAEERRDSFTRKEEISEMEAWSLRCVARAFMTARSQSFWLCGGVHWYVDETQNEEHAVWLTLNGIMCYETPEALYRVMFNL